MGSRISESSARRAERRAAPPRGPRTPPVATPASPLRTGPAASLGAGLAAVLALAALSLGVRADDGPQAPAFAIAADRREPVLAFAAEELERFLPRCGLKPLPPSAPPTGAAWTFDLALDPAMEPWSFAASARQAQGRPGCVVECRGADPTAVLHAAYTALERMGLVFDATGPVLPETAAPERLDGWSATVRPAVRTRAVRLHMNFPMDISSYPLEEAKEYVRNLARLRFNHLIFHSYGGHWYGQAGVFFYGIRYDIPQREPFSRVIRNRRTFSIPEIEPFYDQPAERGRLAKEWLGRVMAEAKRAGLSVRFSVQDVGGAAQGPATAAEVLKTYPAVDALEFITPETLEERDEPVDPAALLEGMGALLAPPAGGAGAKPAVRMPGFFHGLAARIQAARALPPRRDDGRPLGRCAGIYCPAVNFHRAAVPLMRRYVPPDVEYSVLPGWGARTVARNLEAVPMAAEDWRRAMVYSWIEFDGSMYLQQNSVEGLRRLLAAGRRALGAEPLHGVGLNHWRTAENRTAFRYASEALLAGPIEPAAFYADYAARLGLGRPEAYARAMAALDEVESRARDDLFNIGFCFLGVWGRKGLGRIGTWKKDDIERAVAAYEGAAAALRASAEETRRPAGRAYLEFLVNRIGCTVLHLKAVGAMTDLQPVSAGKGPADLSDADRARVRQACDRALVLMDRYMALHAEAIADRGGEGTLINYLTVPPEVVKRIRREYGEPPAPAPKP